MKTVDIDYGREGIVPQIILYTMADFDEYAQLLSGNTERHAQRLVLNKIPKEKWDHCIETTGYGSALNSSILSMFVTGDNALANCESHYQQLLSAIKKQISKGETVIVNKRGGWCTLVDQQIVPNSEKDFSQPKLWSLTLTENAQWLNLENDDSLEQHTIDTLGSEKFSYITGLKYLSNTDLQSCLKEFTESGGSGVYIYTTATDMEQVRQYCSCIADNNDILSVWFQINTDVVIDQDILDTLANAEISATVDYV